jgi:hypothetical protein
MVAHGGHKGMEIEQALVMLRFERRGAELIDALALTPRDLRAVLRGGFGYLHHRQCTWHGEKRGRMVWREPGQCEPSVDGEKRGRMAWREQG